MTSDEAKGYVYIGGALLLAYVAYRAVTKASSAAGAIASTVSNAASAVNHGIATGVGAVGSVFGLPAPDETIDDPAVVRYIIDTEGQLEASKRGTAMAYLKALTMPAGSGHAQTSQISSDVMKRVMDAPVFWQLNLPDGYGGGLSGPSFNDIKDGALY